MKNLLSNGYNSFEKKKILSVLDILLNNETPLSVELLSAKIGVQPQFMLSPIEFLVEKKMIEISAGNDKNNLDTIKISITESGKMCKETIDYLM